MSQMDIEDFLKMQNAPKGIKDLANPLVSQLNAFCKEQDLGGELEADLICVRCSETAVYDARRKSLEEKSAYSYQSIVSGRRVSLIKLSEAIPTAIGNIEYVELCDQKPDGSQDDRISHITIIPVTLSYEEVLEKLKGKGVTVEETVRPHYTSADIVLPSGFTLRLAKEFLVDKIKRDEMI